MNLTETFEKKLNGSKTILKLLFNELNIFSRSESNFLLVSQGRIELN